MTQNIFSLQRKYDHSDQAVHNIIGDGLFFEKSQKWFEVCPEKNIKNVQNLGSQFSFLQMQFRKAFSTCLINNNDYFLH